MKWLWITLAVAAVLIGIGVIAAGSREDGRVSRSSEALSLCDEGTADLNALRLRAAVDKLGQSLARDPGLAEASISRTMAYARLGERQNLRRELARADSLTATLRDDRRRLVAQLRLSQLGQSRFASLHDSVYSVLTARDPDNIYVLEAAASRAARTQDDAEIEKAWRRILDKDPNYANSYNMLGYLELNRGNYDLAIENMQKYAFLAPDLANPHDSLGELYLALGRYEEAEGEFIKSVTMQPDFYLSLINLGKVYIARYELRRGLDILEKLRGQVAGSELEMRVDNEIIKTYLRAGLDDSLSSATARFVGRYPGEDASAVFRAVRMAYAGRASAGRALMDSCLAVWRADPRYASGAKASQGLESTDRQYDAIAADVAGDAPRAAAAWSDALRALEPGTPFYELYYLKYRLAAALYAGGKVRDALSVVDPMLATNPRLAESLQLKVRCHLALGERDAALKTLGQLDRALAKADRDLPILAEAAELHRLLGVGAPAI